MLCRFASATNAHGQAEMDLEQYPVEAVDYAHGAGGDELTPDDSR